MVQETQTAVAKAPEFFGKPAIGPVAAGQKIPTAQKGKQKAAKRPPQNYDDDKVLNRIPEIDHAAPADEMIRSRVSDIRDNCRFIPRHCAEEFQHTRSIYDVRSHTIEQCDRVDPWR